MEKKRRKDQKALCATSEEPETNDILSKVDQCQSNAAFATKTTNPDNPSMNNVPSLNYQYQPILPWAYPPQQHGVEQSHFMSGPSAPTQSPSAVNQWPQFAQQQQNPSNHQVQLGQPPLNYSQSAAHLWLPQQPGYPLPALNALSIFQPFISHRATDTIWQTPAAVGDGTSTTNQHQVPNLYYHFGYPYPGFPGSYFCSPPALVPSCSALHGQPNQKGVIRSPAELSQKNQQLWDAQSTENVQLWSALTHLQTEVNDYKNRLTRLEGELSSMKEAAAVAAAETTAQVSEAVLSEKPFRRGRPKKSVASVDTVHSPDESRRKARARKSAACKVNQFEGRSHLFEKVILNKVEDKDKTCHFTEAGNNGSHVATHSGGNMEINGINSMTPAFHCQFQQEHYSVQTCGNGSSASSEMKGHDVKANKCKTTFPVIPQDIDHMAL